MLRRLRVEAPMRRCSCSAILWRMASECRHQHQREAMNVVLQREKIAGLIYIYIISICILIILIDVYYTNVLLAWFNVYIIFVPWYVKLRNIRGTQPPARVRRGLSWWHKTWIVEFSNLGQWLLRLLSVS